LKKVDIAGKLASPGAGQPQPVAARQKVSAFQDGRQIRAMIGVKMRNADEIEVFEPRPGLTVAQIGAAAGVDENAGMAVDPHDGARRSTRVIRNWPARTQQLERDAAGGTARNRRVLGMAGSGQGQRGRQRKQAKGLGHHCDPCGGVAGPCWEPRAWQRRDRLMTKTAPALQRIATMVSIGLRDRSAVKLVAFGEIPGGSHGSDAMR
jgi:hypothetical protein